MKIWRAVVLLGGVLAFFSVEPLFAQGTAFTYQGRLNAGGTPASGNYDLTFSLFNTNATGTPLVGPVTNSAVSISNGLFTVMIDFGSSVWNGQSNWLEIGVRTNGASGFTTLAPRQQVTPTPYAITAGSVSGVIPSANLSGTYGSQVVFTNANNNFSGIGSNLTLLNASQLASGTVADIRLSTNVALLNGNQTFSGANVFTNFGNSFRGSFFGNGLVGWIPTNGTAIQAVTDTGYLLTNSQLVTVTLPASPNAGDIVRISGAGASGWRVSQNAGQSVIGNFSSFAKSPWTPSSASPLDWRAIASSADGSRLVAVASSTGGGIFTSIDSGLTWSGPFGGLSSANWYAAASSADGSKLPAAVNGGYIYTNSGPTWTAAFGPANWIALATSADGTKLIAAASSSGVYVSSNSGASWTQAVGSANWISVGSSADGTRMIAAISGGVIYGNSSGSWAQQSGSTPASGTWSAVASSADGTKLVAVANGGGIYTSINAGGSWLPQTGGLPASAAWSSVASSADGSKLAAVINGGGIYTSGNFGVTWAQQTNAPVESWNAIDSSADGTKLAAAINNTPSGGIFVSVASPLSATTAGTTGYLIGGQGSAVELQYIGNNQFMPVSFAGSIWGY
ncbi:MAG: hypothetical protein ABSF51_12600 [Verrucomicrobiota bacterium]